MADNVIEFTIKAKDEFSGVFGKLQSLLVVKVAEAFIAAATAAFTLSKVMAETEVKVGTFAKAAGLTVGTMSELAHAAELSQSSLEEVGNGLKFMQRSMAEANQGNLEAVRAFQQLGFATRDSTGRTKDANTALQELADRFNQIQDPAEKTRLAMQVFGRGGQDMIKILAEGSEGLKRMAADAAFLGVVLSDKAVANAKAFDDQTNRLTQSIKGVSLAIANEWIPFLTGLTKAIADQIAQWREPLKEFAQFAVTYFLTLYVTAKQIITGIYNFIVKAFSSAEGFDNFVENAKRAFMYMLDVAALALKSLAVMMVGVFKLAWEAFVEIGKWAWQKVFDFVTRQNLADTFGQVLYERIPEATRGTVDEIKRVFGELKPEWAQLANDGAKGLSDAFGVSAESIKAEVDQLKQKFTEYGEVRKQTEEAVATQTMEQAYKTFLANQKLLEDKLTAEIFYAQSIQETWNLTWDLVALKAQNTSQQISDLIMQTYDQVTTGIGNSVARAIVMGESLSASLKKLMQEVLISVIEMLVKMGVQRLILAALNVSSTAEEAAASLSKGFADVWVNSFASAAAIPVYGWAIAPEVATTNLGIAMAGAGGAMAAGAAMGSAVGAAHGGLTDVPEESTFLLQRGERVLSPNQNRDLTSFLESGGGGVSIENLTISISVPDSRALIGMSANDWKEVVVQRVLPALNALERQGVTQGRLQRQRKR